MNLNTLKKILKFKRNADVIGVYMFFLGALLALVLGATFNLGKLIIGLAIGLSAFFSVHYSNEYFDQDVDVSETTTPFSGGTGILITNPELSEYFKLISLSLIAISIILAIIFTVIFNMTPLILILVILGNFLCWFYTAPPLKLSYQGLGELTVGVTVGFLMPTLGFLVIMGSFNFLLFIFIIPLFLYLFAMSVNNAIPDLETDKKGSKNTMVVRFGRKFSFKLLAVFFTLATLSYLFMYLTSIFPNTIKFSLITLFSIIPLFFGVKGALESTDNREKSIKYAGNNMLAIWVILLLINAYLIYLLFGIR